MCVRLLAQLLRDVTAFQAAILAEEGAPDTVVLASKLAAVGYRLTIRTALGGGPGRSCFQNLRHEFLLVWGDPDCGPGAPQDREFIVDPHFRCARASRPGPSPPPPWVACALRLAEHLLLHWCQLCLCAVAACQRHGRLHGPHRQCS